MTNSMIIKLLLLVFIILALFLGCQYRENVITCTDDVRCNSDLENQINELDDRVTTLEDLIAGLELDIEAQIAILNNLIADLDVEQDNTVIQYNNVQSQITSMVVQLTILNGYSHISELIDPCGDGPGYDEIIIKLSDNSLVVYFETGSKRFLSSLPPGSYQTTDQQACVFAVNSSMEVIW